MRITAVTVILGGVGMLLVWGGITDRNPLVVLRGILEGKGIPDAGSWTVEAPEKGVHKGEEKGAETPKKGVGGFVSV